MRGGINGFVGDAVRLYKVRKNNVRGDIAMTLDQKSAVETAYTAATGKPFANTNVLILGAGQTAREVVAFGTNNKVTAIDLDVIPQGWKPGPYLQLLKQNGATRTAKTVGRKVLGVDRQFSKALCSELGIAKPNPATYLQMDASQMSFPDNTFDVVYSFSVFEHLPDPAAVLQEAKRVLKPGGLMYISLHLYSSEGGCHDLRIFAGERDSIPYWAQLRPAVKHTVIESCYMNEWRMQQWNELFAELCEGGTMSTDQHHDPFGAQLVRELQQLRAAGELSDYSDEELLAVNLRCTWTKEPTMLKATA
jgi:SAM-dependent methyltransferase